jgi:prepilin-type N-terminal cleavage/methylation domain-containing protein
MREDGLTAIELMVVLAIVAIITATTVVWMGNLPEVARSKGAAEQVASAIQQTRAYAVGQVATYRITFPGNDHVSITCTQFCPPGAPSEGPTELSHDATVTPPGTAIEFTSTGEANGAAAVVVFPGAPEQRTVSVTIAGRVQITPP